MGNKPQNCTLARKDKAQGFNKDNCYWKVKSAIAPFEALYNKARTLNDPSNHKKWARKIAFDLSYGDFLEFTEIKSCHYCGEPIVWVDKWSAPYNLDRVDNNVAYTKVNCVVCCSDCNKTKGARFSYDEMVLLGQVISKIKAARIL
jgi:hypothetical protein